MTERARPIRPPTTKGESLDLGLWSSASRIVAGGKLAFFGETTRALPPDVARVSMILRAREIRAFGDMVAQYQAQEGRIAEAYAQMRSRDRSLPALPADVSILDPVYRQYGALQSSAVLEDEWIWRTMPPELYLHNRLDRMDAATRAVLATLYTADTAKSDAYVADPEAVAEAKAFAVHQQKVVPLVAVAVWAVASLAVIGVAGYALYKVAEAWNAPEVAAQANVAATNARTYQQNMMVAEANSRLFQYCAAQMERGEATVSDCRGIVDRMNRDFREYVNPLAVTTCGFGGCWPWAIGAGVVGMLVGSKLARRFGLVRAGA